MSETLARTNALCDSLERVGAVTLTGSAERLRVVELRAWLLHPEFRRLSGIVLASLCQFVVSSCLGGNGITITSYAGHFSLSLLVSSADFQ